MVTLGYALKKFFLVPHPIRPPRLCMKWQPAPFKNEGGSWKLNGGSVKPKGLQ